MDAGAVCIVVLFVMIWGYGQYIEIETVKVFDLVNSVLGKCLNHLSEIGLCMWYMDFARIIGGQI